MALYAAFTGIVVFMLSIKPGFHGLSLRMEMGVMGYRRLFDRRDTDQDNDHHTARRQRRRYGNQKEGHEQEKGS